MYLRDQGIDDDDEGVGRVRQAKGLSDNDEGVGRGRGIRDVYEGLETTVEAAGARRRDQGIYDDDEGVGGGRWAQRLQQRQRRRWRRIDGASKGIRDVDGGGSRSAMGLVDWQRQWSVDFP